MSVTWRDGGKAFEYRKDGKTYRYDIAAKKPEETKAGAAAEAPTRGGRGGRGGGAGRGQQFGSLASPDGTLKAFYRDRNLWISDPNGLIELAVTTDGNEKDRIKNGKASWVYGEEFNQNTAFWWSPDSKKLAYYRFERARSPTTSSSSTRARSRTSSRPSLTPRRARPTRSPTSSFTT